MTIVINGSFAAFCLHLHCLAFVILAFYVHGFIVFSIRALALFLVLSILVCYIFLDMNKSLLAVFITGVLTTGCGKSETGVSVSVGHDSTAEASSGSSLERQKSMSVGIETKASTTMPATKLIAEALLIENAGGERWRKAWLNGSQNAKNKEDLLASIASSLSPVQAWPKDPTEPQNRKQLESWAHGIETSLLFTSEVLWSIAEKMDGRVMRNAESAKKEIQERWNKSSLKELEGVFSEAKAKTEQKRARDFDLSGDSVHWISGAGDVQCGANGCVLKQSGVIVFGDGFLEGRKIEIAMDRNSGTSMTQSQSIDSKVSGTETNKASGTASTK